MSHKDLFDSFRQCITSSEHAQLKGWPPRFQPTAAKTSISTILHCFMVFVAWKNGADIEKCHNKSPWRPQTKKSSQSLTVTGMSCLDRGRTANFGYRKFTVKNHSNPSLVHNPYIQFHDVRACDSQLIIHPYRLSDLLMS